MDEVNENCEDIAEVIQVAGGEVGKPGGAKSGVQSSSFVAAGVPRHEAGEETDWTTVQKRVTRGPSRQRKVLADKGPLKQNTFQFYADKSKKCELETPIQIYEDKNDQVDEIKQLRQLVLQILRQNDEFKNEQIKSAESLIKLQEQVGKLLEVQAQDKTTIRSLQETNAKLHQDHQQATQTTWATIASKIPAQDSTEAVKAAIEGDPCSIIIFINAWKGDHRDFDAIKDACQRSISGIKALNGVEIAYLRPLPNDKISVVFRDQDMAEKARQHPLWLSKALLQSRLKGEQWYPIKCDMVAKQAVLLAESTEGCVIKRDVEANFRQENSNVERDCAVRKVRWLSRANADKATGSLVLWLKSKRAADHVIARGTAIFGSCGAFCSPCLQMDNQGPCYRCNTYGHMQANCKRAVKCGICSKGHATRSCINKEEPKCPACAGAHVIMDSRKCPRHLRHARRPPADMASQSSTSSGNDTRQKGPQKGPEKGKATALTTSEPAVENSTWADEMDATPDLIPC
ncbi:Hypothetical protein D9617_69g077950 [Elsinoe fawcettii]|nr:Hypothetical protein D9617_69g077950 [Elsinoe fawcettii]